MNLKRFNSWFIFFHSQIKSLEQRKKQAWVDLWQQRSGTWILETEGERRMDRQGATEIGRRRMLTGGRQHRLLLQCYQGRRKHGVHELWPMRSCRGGGGGAEHGAAAAAAAEEGVPSALARGSGSPTHPHLSHTVTRLANGKPSQFNNYFRFEIIFYYWNN